MTQYELHNFVSLIKAHAILRESVDVSQEQSSNVGIHVSKAAERGLSDVRLGVC
jgi:hypothetical protein